MRGIEGDWARHAATSSPVRGELAGRSIQLDEGLQGAQLGTILKALERPRKGWGARGRRGVRMFRRPVPVLR